MEGLGINLPTLLVQVVNFVILLAILYLFAYKRVLKMLDERSRKIKESIAQTEQIQEQAARAEEEVSKQLTGARKQGQELIAQATKTGEELRQRAQQDAKQDAEVLIARARKEIQHERDEAIDELRKEFAELTIMAAEKVIERSLDKKAHRELIDKVLEESTISRKD